jgi:hypothetical protein
LQSRAEFPCFAGYLIFQRFRYGKLKLLDDYDLVIETRNQQDMDALAEKLEELFGKELWLSKIQKQTLT